MQYGELLQEPTPEDESGVPPLQCALRVFSWCPLGGSDGCARVPAALERKQAEFRTLQEAFLAVSGIKSRTFPTSWTDPHTARRALQILHWKEARLVSLSLSSTSPGLLELLKQFSPAVRFCAAGSARFNKKCWFNRRRKSGQIIRTWVGSCRVDRGLFRDVCVMKAKVQNQNTIHYLRNRPTDTFLADSCTLCLPDIEVFQELWVWICAGSESWQSQLPVDFD